MIFFLFVCCCFCFCWILSFSTRHQLEFSSFFFVLLISFKVFICVCNKLRVYPFDLPQFFFSSLHYKCSFFIMLINVFLLFFFGKFDFPCFHVCAKINNQKEYKTFHSMHNSQKKKSKWCIENKTRSYAAAILILIL